MVMVHCTHSPPQAVDEKIHMTTLKSCCLLLFWRVISSYVTVCIQWCALTGSHHGICIFASDVNIRCSRKATNALGEKNDRMIWNIFFVLTHLSNALIQKALAKGIFSISVTFCFPTSTCWGPGSDLIVSPFFVSCKFPPNSKPLEWEELPACQVLAKCHFWSKFFTAQ